MKSNLVFGTAITPGSETNTLLLIHSIRTFGGSMSDCPIWVSFADNGKPLSKSVLGQLRTLNAHLMPFSIEESISDFFFSKELAGLRLMEEQARDQADYLVWLDANTLLLHEPVDLLLPRGKVLGYRPVHLLLLGSRLDTPPDPFWTAIYRSCGVSADRVFPMQPVVEDLQMRPYFNAGFLVNRPTSGLFHRWYDLFMKTCQSPQFKPFFEQDKRYRIFMHQAILTGTILSLYHRDELMELPPTYNYPLHLFDRDTTLHRPKGMDELVTFRHEGFHEEDGWQEKFPGSTGLKNRLTKILEQITFKSSLSQ